MSNRFLKNILFFVFLVGVLMVLYPIYIENNKEEITKERLLSALLDGENGIVYLRSRTQEANCQAEGPLPDKDCTPGDVFEDATKERICVSGYSSTVRNVSTDLKEKIFEEYGIEYPVEFGSYEIDHLIPLALGGSNDISNLWPKSAEPFPGFYEKNITGNYLHEEVCKGNIALSVAQERMADNWTLIYYNLSEAKIKELKAKYKNWADNK